MKKLLLPLVFLACMPAREPLAQRIVHTDPAKYRPSKAVHDGAGQLDFMALLDAHSLDTNLYFLHRGVIQPKSGIGAHYHNQCEEMFVIFDCLGPNANGATHGPSLIRSAVVRHDENGNLIAPVVRDGRPDLGMPSVPLSPNQVSDIVAFVKSRVAAADIRSANRSVVSSGDKLLTGNSSAGKALFEGAGGCASCHSPTGDLAGISRATGGGARGTVPRYLSGADVGTPRVSGR